MALRGLQLLRVLLGLRESAEVVAELLADRALDSGQPLLLEHGGEAGANLHAPGDVLLGRVHRQLGGQLVLELLDDRGALAQALGLEALPDGVTLRLLELGGELLVEPLRLAHLAAEVLLRLAELADLLMRQVERLEEHVLGDLVGPGFDHRQAVLRADDDQVEGRLLEVLLVRRVEDELPVDAAHAHGAHRPEERQRRDHQCSRRPVDAEDVVRRDQVGRQHGADHLHLVAEALRPERPDRAVDHARGERRALGGAPLTLEEAAGDLPGSVGPLFDVDRQREEVRAFARLRPAHGGREHHCVAGAHHNRPVCLLGELAGLESDLFSADLDGN